jgi:uncharacterized membrane protein
MSKKKNSQEQKNSTKDKNARKRQAVMGTNESKGLPKAAVIVGLLVLIAGGIYLFTGNENPSSPVSTSPAIERSATEIRYPVDLFDDGRAKHFQYDTEDGTTIKYFVLKSSDGIIRAAFDACDVCWPAGKGYYQAGDVMVCRNCGRQFASVRINEVKGGCNPAPLRRTLADNKLVIQVSQILTGKRYFNFKTRS